jgi:hypothetical protein
MTDQERWPGTDEGLGKDESPRNKRIQEAMERRTADAVGQAREAATQARETGKRALQNAGTGVKQAGSSARDAAKGAVSGVQARFRDAADGARQASKDLEDELWADYLRKTGKDRRDDT